MERTTRYTAAIVALAAVFWACNTPPRANAGADQVAFVGQTVVLDGSGSWDQNLDAITYSWSSPTATLSNPDSVSPSFVPQTTGTYVVTLVVTDDNQVQSYPDSVTIAVLGPLTSMTVRDADEPTVAGTNPGQSSLDVTEKTTGFATVKVEVSPDPGPGGSQVLFEVSTFDGATADPPSGSFAVTPLITLNPSSGASGRQFYIKTWFDANGNGSFDGGTESDHILRVDLVDLEVSNVHVELDEGTWKAFATDGDNDFDPLYDDVLVGGHENFEIQAGFWDAHALSKVDADTAAQNSHTARIRFDVTAPATARLVVYRDNNPPFDDELIQVAEYPATAGTNSIPFWDIDDEDAGDYVAYVGVYSGDPGSTGYAEDGLDFDEEPVSPAGMSSGRVYSGNFNIERQPWGVVHSFSEFTEPVTGTCCTTLEWWMFTVGTQTAVSFLGSLPYAGHIAGVEILTWAYWMSVDVANGGIANPGPPAGAVIEPSGGAQTPCSESDTISQVTWDQSVYDWNGTAYANRTSSLAPVFPGESGSWTYFDFRREHVSGYSFLDFSEFAGIGGDDDSYDTALGNKAAFEAAPYFFPVGFESTPTEMLYDPGPL